VRCQIHCGKAYARYRTDFAESHDRNLGHTGITVYGGLLLEQDWLHWVIATDDHVLEVALIGSLRKWQSIATARSL
jgi:predicted DNA binding protein